MMQIISHNILEGVFVLSCLFSCAFICIIIDDAIKNITNKFSLLTQDRDEIEKKNREIQNDFALAKITNTTYEEQIKELSSKNYALSVEINSRYETEDAELVKENERLLNLCKTLEQEIERLRLKRKRDKSNRKTKYNNSNYKDEFIEKFVNEEEY